MSYVITSSYLSLLDLLFRNSVTGNFYLPAYTFNATAVNPFINDISPLNTDPHYRKNVVRNFHTRLVEKWLYKEPIYRSLLKYFKVSRNGDMGEISLISDPDKPVDKHKPEDERYILRYIEKYFAKKKFVKKVLKEYVAVTNINWYDLFNNTDTIKELFRRKLKKLIIAAIYTIKKKDKS